MSRYYMTSISDDSVMSGVSAARIWETSGGITAYITVNAGSYKTALVIIGAIWLLWHNCTGHSINFRLNNYRSINMDEHSLYPCINNTNWSIRQVINDQIVFPQHWLKGSAVDAMLDTCFSLITHNTALTKTATFQSPWHTILIKTVSKQRWISAAVISEPGWVVLFWCKWCGFSLQPPFLFVTIQLLMST